MKAEMDYCCKNDKFGLYDLADQGKLNHLAGVNEDYDEPDKAIVVLAHEKEKGLKVIVEVCNL